MRKKVAECYIGELFTKIYVVTGQGNAGSYTSPCISQGRNHAILEIGIDGNWPQTLATLLHEVVEMVLLIMQLSFEQVHAWSSTKADRLFVFNHNELSEVMERVGDGISCFQLVVWEAWEKYGDGKDQKKKRKRRKKK